MTRWQKIVDWLFYTDRPPLRDWLQHPVGSYRLSRPVACRGCRYCGLDGARHDEMCTLR